MNLTLLAAVVMLITWFLLLFVRTCDGTIHLLYAPEFPDRPAHFVGAPRFVS